MVLSKVNVSAAQADTALSPATHRAFFLSLSSSFFGPFALAPALLRNNPCVNTHAARCGLPARYGLPGEPEGASGDDQHGQQMVRREVPLGLDRPRVKTGWLQERTRTKLQPSPKMSQVFGNTMEPATNCMTGSNACTECRWRISSPLPRSPGNKLTKNGAQMDTSLKE